LAEIPGVEVFPVASNILYFRLAEGVSKTPEQVLDGLAERGVRILGRLDGRFRLVTHYWISDEDVEVVIDALRAVV
jgi:threonine aldolase